MLLPNKWMNLYQRVKRICSELSLRNSNKKDSLKSDNMGVLTEDLDEVVRISRLQEHFEVLDVTQFKCTFTANTTVLNNVVERDIVSRLSRNIHVLDLIRRIVLEMFTLRS